MEVPQGRPPQHRALPGRALRLLRLPQDQGLGGPAQGRPRPHPASRARPTRSGSTAGSRSRRASGPRACRRSGTCASTRRAEQKVRNDVEANAVVAYLEANSHARTATRRRPRATWPPAARPSRPSAAWAATASATTSAGMERLRGRLLSAPTGPTSTAPAARSTPAGSTPGSRTPRATGTTRACRNLRLTDKEAADITAYLMSLKNDAFARAPAARPWTRASATTIIARAPAGGQRAGQAGRRSRSRPWTTSSARSSWARRRSPATAASAATRSRASRRPRPSAWS